MFVSSSWKQQIITFAGPIGHAEQHRNETKALWKGECQEEGTWGWGGNSYSGFFTVPGNMSSGTNNAIPQGSHTQ